MTSYLDHGVLVLCVCSVGYSVKKKLQDIDTYKVGACEPQVQYGICAQTPQPQETLILCTAIRFMLAFTPECALVTVYFM